MPEAVYLRLRCLQPGCQLGEPSTSVGLELTDEERMQTAEAYVHYAARSCRARHAGVEAVFSDEPTRTIVFSKTGGVWHAH